MADEPIPPGEPEDFGDQGLPGRAMPFQPSPTMIQFGLAEAGPDNEALVVMIFDTPATRLVSYWRPEDLRVLVGNMETVLEAFPSGPKLSIADVADLKALDVSDLLRP